MRRTTGTAAIITLIGLMLTACSSGSRMDQVLTQPAETWSGEATTLQEQLGESWAVVNFWASFCEPCVREMPALQQLSQEEPALRVIGVNAADRPEFAARIMTETGVTYRMIVDGRGDLMSAAQIRSLPGTLIITPDGEIVARHIGELDLQEMRQMLTDAGYPG